MTSDYQRIEAAIHYIHQHMQEQPTLEDIANHINLSPYHCQRVFQQWAGVSPKRFLQYLTVEAGKQLLVEPNSILDVSYSLGLSSASRLHDHFINLEAITPGEYKQQGNGLKISYGIHDSPFGSMLLAVTDRGICGLSFLSDDLDMRLLELQQQWPNAQLIKESLITEPFVSKIFDCGVTTPKLNLITSGSNFQIQVWKALLKIPDGSLCSYSQIAQMIDRPKAARAVATAIASNHIGYLIPCHRVIRSSGELSHYRWGQARKHAMIAWEAGHFEQKTR